MSDWNTVLHDTDWGRLFHAYGVADDTPGHLRNLASPQAAERQAALTHLHSAILHQGTIYSATPAAVGVITTLLRDVTARAALDADTLAALVAFLGQVGSSLNEIEPPQADPYPSDAELDTLILHLRDDEDGEDEEGWGSPLISTLMCHAFLALRAMAGDVLDALAAYLSDDNDEIRREAVNAAAQWGVMAPDSAAAHAVAARIQARLDAGSGRDARDDRAGLILALGQLGHDVSRWLDDADDAIRACAALFVPDARATAILVTALTRPDQVDAWFTQRPPYFPMHTRLTLLGALIERQVPLAQLLPAALALIARTQGGLLANSEWGRILTLALPDQAAAFRPGQRPPLPAHLSPAQHAVLLALHANPDLWNPRDGNAGLARMTVGLPDTRDALAAYLAATPVR